ncbi:glycosyltransferase family 2 protein [Chroogloeocystis siderophila]|jgi:glycosyltransferase involved in cell wall biosynthesis|uniref:Glycosyl transferase n=1 Tax=Chroogloeocystis siderophila 5.2 s.c.1 TaxID=247279 RepID=A0A1U7HVU4_9CHRO|nr:glycosyltransferase family 2 protein [Chroogloeocystis siderophila]OKH27673.1 glycosyl transferase [Chroogloeocystis siderophila 5.2 s.c.1]
MISVITPVYNGAKYIENCLKVVIEQNCSDLEHIIIDGGSTDATVDIIKRYAQEYSHIRWLSEKDRGQSDAMNKGIRMAAGNIIAILNVDDFYEPNVLNRVSVIFENLPEPSLLVGNCNILDDDDKLKRVNKPKRLKITDLLVGYNINPFPFNPSAYFYHKQLHEKVGLYEVDEHYAMDVDFLLKAVQAANVQYINETWGNYRQIAGTKTVNDINSGQNAIRLEQLMQKYQQQLPVYKQWLIAVKREYYKAEKRLEYFSKNPNEILPRIGKRLGIRPS